jgi:hypothetical protein
VRDSVGERGHALRRYFLADVDQVIIRLFCALLGFPIVKIHVPASFIDVIGHDPGNGSYAAVPGPNCLIGMAIAARSHQRGLDFLGDIHVVPKRPGSNRGGIGPPRLNELNGHQENNQSKDRNFHPGPVHSEISILVPPSLEYGSIGIMGFHLSLTWFGSLQNLHGFPELLDRR